ncbi:MAG: rod shape-determining protein MreC [Lachnospiraceae bacterium]|nr:rod shape-determining protein MreC [Lachnospiraceae bacterium]
MNRGKNFTIQPKYLIFFLTIICIIFMLCSTFVNGFTEPFKKASSTVIIPLEKGVNHIGRWVTDKSDDLKTIDELTKQNKKLKQQIDALQEDNNLLAQNKYELKRLRELFKLDSDYTQYEKVGARVIGRDASNWFNIFTIDKGANDGIEKDMNVISGGGLVGIVTDVGKNYAKVRAIIDDESSVSVSFASSSDTGIVSGDLHHAEDGYLNITGIEKEVAVTEGDMVITSKISDKFLPGILVGYIQEVKQDANELTQSGTISTVVDFKHIDEVLVILQKKDNKENLDEKEVSKK